MPANAGELGSIPDREDPLEKEMATHSSTLAWKIPWTGEPGRLQFMGQKESDMTERLICIIDIIVLFFNIFKIFFLMWFICKVFIEFVTILLLFYVLGFWPEACGILAS